MIVLKVDNKINISLIMRASILINYSNQLCLKSYMYVPAQFCLVLLGLVWFSSFQFSPVKTPLHLKVIRIIITLHLKVGQY